MSVKAVRPQARLVPCRGFLSPEDYDLSFPKFDDVQRNCIGWAAMISSNAAIVLTFDPLTDQVLLVEQFRVGPFLRGDTEPWCFELIAGLRCHGETPDQAASREAKDGAGP